MSNQYRPWSDAEIQLLRDWWGVRTIADVSAHLGRTLRAVSNQALVIGLRVGKRQGLESRTGAAKRHGVDHHTMAKIIARAHLTWHPCTSVGSHGYLPSVTRKLYATVDIDEAFAKYRPVDGEPLRVMAERLRVSTPTLTRCLAWIGVERPSSLRRGSPWRVSRESAERAIAEYDRRESLSAGARRHGLTPVLLSKWMRRNGMVSPHKRGNAMFRPEDIDRVVAAEMPRAKALIARARKGWQTRAERAA